MTTIELIKYYADLLIIQYIGKPKAYETIKALVTPMVMPQTSLSDEILPLAVLNGFNLTKNPVAIGVQLDIIGKYFGVTRYGSVDGSFIELDDADFLTLIKFAAAKNYTSNSMYEIQTVLINFFGDQIQVYDYQNMHMSYLINSSLGSENLIKLLIKQNLLPKPMGVQLGITIYAPVIDKFFGFRTYVLEAAKVVPFNTYADFKTTYLWLSYANGIQ